MSKIQYKDVEAAIAMLQADGGKVTNDTILAKLGRGSKSTIHKHFRSWQEAQPRPQAEERKLPDGIFKAIIREIDEVEAKAVAALKIELAEVQHNADELAVAGEIAEDKISELEKLLASERETVTKLTAVLHEKDNQISKLNADLKTQTDNVERLRTELAKSELRLEGYVELKSEHKLLSEQLRAALIEAAELRGASGSGKNK
jgi:chromosome segregation ATPase